MSDKQLISHTVRAIEQVQKAKEIPGLSPDVIAALDAALIGLYGVPLTAVFQHSS